MDAAIERALKTDGLIDMTTTGRKAGNPPLAMVEALPISQGERALLQAALQTSGV